ncbi:helix-turn-helix transcriptional regulator [Clostridium sp. AM58-1XD]|uniref:helix-turn-helix domain-containing protein n=1 Tax=Clostridium sp. AM58-1XD TaxID=2292307 RepID=UPI000E544556|nr:helix-turn-helix transcriptional regulator [Clostridium sp. AM58-1XD]RGY96642.1 XRE family transcriptional regulator [Clostridium sp. AM58-1XD]
MIDFSDKLKKLREGRHLTQSQVAQQIGCTSSMISAYESAIRRPSYENLIQLSKLFHVSTDYLLGNDSKSALDTAMLTNEEINALASLISIMKNKK